MPARNASKTIAAAVSSTLLAMGKDSELLIYDDASNDGTSEIIERLAQRDNRVQLTQGTSQLGSGRARQLLIQGSDSELVANMDADDITFPHRFFKSRRWLAGHDIVFGSYMRFGSRPGQFSVSSPMIWQQNELPIALLFTNPLLHSSMLATRKAIVEAGGYRALPRGQDYDLWLRASAKGLRLAKFGSPITGYRLHSSQISGGTDYSDQMAADPDLKASYRNLLAYLGEKTDHKPSSPTRNRGCKIYALLGSLPSRKQKYLISRESNSLAPHLRECQPDCFWTNGDRPA